MHKQVVKVNLYIFFGGGGIFPPSSHYLLSQLSNYLETPPPSPVSSQGRLQAGSVVCWWRWNLVIFPKPGDFHINISSCPCLGSVPGIKRTKGLGSTQETKGLGSIQVYKKIKV